MRGDGFTAASTLVNERGKALGPQLLEAIKQNRDQTPDDLIALLRTRPWEQRPYLGLILCRHLAYSASKDRNLNALENFLFRFAAHLQLSEGDHTLTSEQASALARASHISFSKLPRASRRQLQLADEILLRNEVQPSEESWISTVGLTSAEFRDAIDQLSEELKRGMRATRPSRTPAPQHKAPLLRGSPPPWLTPSAHRSDDADLAATANWVPTDSDATALSREVLTQAWQAYSANDLVTADAYLAPIRDGLGREWMPIETADGMRTWHWIRLMTAIGRLIENDTADRRRLSLSAFLLALRCVPEDQELIEGFLSDAISGMIGGDTVSARSWAAYTIRAVHATDHEFALRSYDNVEKADLRRVWGDHFAIANARQSSTVDLAQELTTRLTKALNNLRVTPRDVQTFSRAFADLQRQLDPFLDQSEVQLFRDVGNLAKDTNRLLSAERLDHRDAKDLVVETSEILDQIALSGSLLLQDHAAPVVVSIESQIRLALHELGETSRPLLVPSLLSPRLPLGAARGTPFDIRLRIANVGNAPALAVEIRLKSEQAGVDTTTSLTEINAGAESELEIRAHASEYSGPAVDFACTLEWADGLDQRFTSTTMLTAEAERPGSWSENDDNPFSLGQIHQETRLVGRAQDLEALTAALAGGGSRYITGQKRVGKTSLVQVLLGQLSERRGWACAPLPLGYALLQNATSAGLIRAVLEKIDAAVERAYPEAPVRRLGSSLETESRFASAATNWLMDLKGALPNQARVVIAIDDFDELPDGLAHGPEADSLFLFIRSLVDETWLSLILIGSERLPTLIREQEHKLNQVLPYPVTNFKHRSSTQDLLLVPTAGKLEWDPQAVDRVHALCAGNPYYETLVAHEVWATLRAANRSYVTLSDINAAVGSVAGDSPASQFAHLWADSPQGMRRDARPSIVASAALRATARCGGESLAPASHSEIVNVAKHWIEAADSTEIEAQLRELVRRGVLTVEDGGDRYRISIPIAGLWLLSNGGRILDAEYATTSIARAMAPVFTERDLVDLSDKLTYQGQSVSEMRIKAWLEQFGDYYHQYLAYLMLRRMVTDGYFTHSRLEKCITDLKTSVLNSPVSQAIARDGKTYSKNVVLVDHASAGDSTQQFLSVFAKSLHVKKADIKPIDETVAAVAAASRPMVIMLLDDFAGSGSHLSSTARDLIEGLDTAKVDWRESTEILIGAAVASSRDVLPNEVMGLALHPVVGHVAGDKLKPFSEGSTTFSSTKELDDARDLLSGIGDSLLPGNPLGYGGSALLVLFEFNCPNNAPPIFWQIGKQYGGREWKPLFPRRV